MAKLFNQVLGNKPKRNVFDLGHERKFSMNMGDLVPILCEEVVPGDTFQMNTEVMMRLAPMVSPVMHRVNVYTHFFFVPYRLIWDAWKDFITGGEDGEQEPVRPYFVLSSGTNYSTLLGRGTLADYLGVTIPEGSLPINHSLNALPFRAYATIYNEYYRDQNLQPKLNVSKSSGAVSGSEGVDIREMQKRNWEKDYFTSALPWTQRGGDVSLPLGGTAPVQVVAGHQQNALIKLTGLNTPPTPGDANLHTAAGDSGALNADYSGVYYDPNGTLETDMSQADAVTIEELRRATKLQRWLERNARSGSRYIEQILAHFGVKSSDARLQRPEYLGGGKSPVVISEVLQTSSTDTETPQGNMAGHGVSVGNTHKFKKFFEEHGYVIGIISVLPKTSYLQGTRRHFYKSDKFDYYWPEFAQLGEQPVYKGELYSDWDDDDQETFGYQSRYAEYKHIPSSCHGDFKGNLDFWHMSRKFTSEPALNSAFVKADPTHRVFAVTDVEVPKLYVQIYNDLKAIRPMPYFNVPTL